MKISNFLKTGGIKIINFLKYFFIHEWLTFIALIGFVVSIALFVTGLYVKFNNFPLIQIAEFLFAFFSFFFGYLIAVYSTRKTAIINSLSHDLTVIGKLNNNIDYFFDILLVHQKLIKSAFSENNIEFCFSCEELLNYISHFNQQIESDFYNGVQTKLSVKINKFFTDINQIAKYYQEFMADIKFINKHYPTIDSLNIFFDCIYYFVQLKTNKKTNPNDTIYLTDFYKKVQENKQLLNLKPGLKLKSYETNFENLVFKILDLCVSSEFDKFIKDFEIKYKRINEIRYKSMVIINKCKFNHRHTDRFCYQTINQLFKILKTTK